MIEIARAMKPANFAARCWHVTFAFNKGKCLAIGCNKPGFTHPRNLALDYVNGNNEHVGDTIGVHSELSCFLRLGLEDCSGISFYNVRIDRNNSANFSFPCRGCRSLFKQINARNVFATNKNGQFEKVEL